MLRFLIARLLQLLLILGLISLLVFSLFKLIPGDYWSEMELNPTIPSQSVAQLRKDFGLDQPVYVQYGMWLKSLLHGDLGYAFSQRRPAAHLIEEHLENTALLALCAFALTLAVAVPLGILAASRAGGAVDRFILVGALLGLSIPTVLSSVLLLIFRYRLGWLTQPGTGTRLGTLLLAALALALPAIALFLRSLRAELIETFNHPFLLAAEARGLSRPRLLYHALRSALNPLISLAGMLLGGLLSGAVVVEKVFDWPGMGSLIVDSILSRDLFVALDCLLVASLLVVSVNFVSDFLLALNDPRMRLFR